MRHTSRNTTGILLVTNPTNIRYLTGFVGVDTRDAYLLLTKNQIYLFTNSLYREQAKQLKKSSWFMVHGSSLHTIEISRDNPFTKRLANILEQENIKKLGFEEADVTVAEHNKLKKELKGVTFVPTKNRIEEIRMIKRTDEIEKIRRAARITDECFTYILTRLRIGVTESEIAWEIETFFRNNGAQSAFSPIVAFGKNTSQPHYMPFDSAQGKQSTKLKDHDVALFDFGARVNGYCADMTRVVFVGKPKSEWINAYETVLAAQQKALDYLASCSRPGLEFTASGAMADKIARKSIEKSGFPPYPHSLGHAVGLEIHEAPRLTIKKNAMLKPGMVITIEPGVYIEGAYGIRIEDLVLLKKNDIEIVSKSKKVLIIL